MCLALLAVNIHPRYRLIIAANRDEFYDRPTVPAAWWQDLPHVLGGRDLKQGGSWLAVARDGRFALVTNYREGGKNRERARSRGLLVKEFLATNESPAQYLARIARHDGEYNGYNLIVGNRGEIGYHSNRLRETCPRELEPGVRRLEDGVYGLSNHLLDTPWPKVIRSKETLFGLLEREGQELVEGLFTMLGDHTRPGDEHLPDTGIGIEWERLLSAAFIASNDYGTRSSTVVLFERSGACAFIERTYGPQGTLGPTVSYAFSVTPAAVS